MKAFPISSCLGLAMAVCVLSTGSSSFLAKHSTQAPANAPSPTLPRLPGGRPDLQGLWLKSAGGFQGLFIGSLDGTNLAAGGARGGGRGARGGPAPTRYEYTADAEAERLDRLKRGYEDPEARCHLPGVPRSLDQPGGLYPVQIIQDEKYVAKCFSLNSRFKVWLTVGRLWEVESSGQCYFSEISKPALQTASRV